MEQFEYEYYGIFLVVTGDAETFLILVFIIALRMIHI